MAESEIARFRRQQALEEEAARRGLYDYAVVSRHDFIQAKMNRAAIGVQVAYRGQARSGPGVDEFA